MAADARKADPWMLYLFVMLVIAPIACTSYSLLRRRTLAAGLAASLKALFWLHGTAGVAFILGSYGAIHDASPGERVLISLLKATLVWRSVSDRGGSCPLGGGPHAMWSRAVAEACTDAHPAGDHGARGCLGRAYDKRRPRDSTAGELAARWGGWDKLLKAKVLYVPPCDFADFVREVFVRLPQRSRVVLVTGNEDVGVPRELWGAGRCASYARDVYSQNLTRKHSQLPDLGSLRETGAWVPPALCRPPPRFGLELQRFIEDPRLVAWFVQNYDATGCNVYSGCSALDVARVPSVRKIRHLPIGLDFHTREGSANVLEPACDQWARLEATRGRALSFGDRPLVVLSAFSAHNRERRAVAKRVAMLGDAHVLRLNLSADERADLRLAKVGAQSFWDAASRAAFVVAPTGNGVDSHRVWEALALGAVPIVLKSSLAELYAPLPVVQVDSWAELTAAALVKWSKEIRRRFGPAPFTKQVQLQLTLPYWCGIIRGKCTEDSGSMNYVLSTSVDTKS